MFRPAGALAAVVSLLGAPPAAAGDLSYDIVRDVVQFTAHAGEANELHVDISAEYPDGTRWIRFADARRPTPGLGCRPASYPESAECELKPATTLSIDLGDERDSAHVYAAISSTISGGGGMNDLAGGPAADRLVGGPLNDRLDGGDGADTLEGGPGEDDLDGGLGPDLLEGGDGFDNASYVMRTAPITVRLDGEPGDGEPGEGDDARTEGVTGSAANDTLLGGEGRHMLVGMAGDDYLHDVTGRDTFDGGNGADHVVARDGANDDDIQCGPGDRIERDWGDWLRGCGTTVLTTPPPAPPAAVPTPEQGNRVVVHVLRGSVLLRPDLRRLSGTTSVPVGSVIDARRGSLRLSARGEGRLHNAASRGGVFRVTQSARNPAVRLTTLGGRFDRCRRASRSIVRKLTVAARGSFRVVGQAAETRGTTGRWAVLDRCDGTLVRLERGAVRVRSRKSRRWIGLRGSTSRLIRR